MLPKDPSTTASSKSVTSKAASAFSSGNPLETEVQFVKGVGPRLGMVFESRGMGTVRDLLYFFPRAYEDRSRLAKVRDLENGAQATVSLTILNLRKIPARGRVLFEVRCQDENGENLYLKYFRMPRGMDAKFKPGTQIIATGTVKQFMGKPEMVHPEITWNVGVSPEKAAARATQRAEAPLAGTAGAGAAASEGESSADFGRIVPIYTEIEGISTRVLRKVLWEACDKFAARIPEDLPARYLEAHNLPALGKAIREVHFPEDGGASVEKLTEFDTPAHSRLIYEEFFKFQYLVLRQRLKMRRNDAVAIGAEGRDAAAALEKQLPFKLTNDQKTAMGHIVDDLSQPHPMNRLIQGDVGSGKTAVALLSAGAVLSEGGQAALMAPTEILAEQHYNNALKLFGGLLNVALLTGKTSAAERKKLLPRLEAGEPILLIGTHALIEDPVRFKNLTFVMIDEQHRFGVEQRRTLRDKGTRPNKATGAFTAPHILILTATPIPRTLALTAYGDLSVTSIRELPPGRSPISTKVVQERSERARSYDLIRRELHNGRQAYFIYPLVNDSEAEGFTQLKSAVTEAENLAHEIFPDFKIGLLHGQMKPEEKARIMAEFKSGEIKVLVSTTVVEVGVDVPNATVMVIEHAERFGLSQLHQLRGRVGRGQHQSYCFLLSHPRTGEQTAGRLNILEQTNDGFKIAEADLEIRGPGEFTGTRQSGGLPFRLANLVRDREWLLKARNDAIELLQLDPELEQNEHRPLRAYFEREGRLQFERLKTS